LAGWFDTSRVVSYDAEEANGGMGILSVPHLIIIFVVALIVFGPQKLPELARSLGKIMGDFRRATSELRGTFDEHLRDLEREAQLLDTRNREPAKPAEAGGSTAAAPEPEKLPHGDTKPA
jgi:TatA/E family protein of Tat protein translocase